MRLELLNYIFCLIFLLSSNANLFAHDKKVSASQEGGGKATFACSKELKD